MQIIYDESIPANDQPLVMTRGDHERGFANSGLPGE